MQSQVWAGFGRCLCSPGGRIFRRQTQRHRRARSCDSGSALLGTTNMRRGVATMDREKVSDISRISCITGRGVATMDREKVSDISRISSITGRGVATMDREKMSDISRISRITDTAKEAYTLVDDVVADMVSRIHHELARDLRIQPPVVQELGDMARYYFDGAGKAVRPVIAVCVGRMANCTKEEGVVSRVEVEQCKVAMVTEMIHTASLLHDDVLDHADTRRGKASVNARWDARRSTLAGDFVLAVGSRLLAELEDEEVVVVLSQVLADLVQGELMQLQTKTEEEERFEHYLTKTFNKTASLMAYSCQANAMLAGVDKNHVEAAFQYGRNIGIAFQLVDDLLDFVASADQLGKPAATDLKLGLATAPVLFAAKKFPELNSMIARRFERTGDVELAFELVQKSGGLLETRDLARSHCGEATKALDSFTDSEYKSALVNMCDTVLTRMK